MLTLKLAPLANSDINQVDQTLHTYFGYMQNIRQPKQKHAKRCLHLPNRVSVCVCVFCSAKAVMSEA